MLMDFWWSIAGHSSEKGPRNLVDLCEVVVNPIARTPIVFRFLERQFGEPLLHVKCPPGVVGRVNFLRIKIFLVSTERFRILGGGVQAIPSVG